MLSDPESDILTDNSISWQHKGLGLRLHISKTIIESLGGKDHPEEKLIFEKRFQLIEND